MIFVIIFILAYLAIAVLVYGALIGSLEGVYLRSYPRSVRASAAVIGLGWPVALCFADIRSDVFHDHPLKF